jgi:hypothetical protein
MPTMTVPSELVVAIQTDDLPCEDDEWIRVSRDTHITPVHIFTIADRSCQGNSPLTKTAAHPRCRVYNGAQIRRVAWKRPGAGKLSVSSASEFHRAVRAAKRMAPGQMVQHGRAACEQS